MKIRCECVCVCVYVCVCVCMCVYVHALICVYVYCVDMLMFFNMMKDEGASTPQNLVDYSALYDGVVRTTLWAEVSVEMEVCCGLR